MRMSRTNDTADKSNKNILMNYSEKSRKMNKKLFNHIVALALFSGLGQFSAIAPGETNVAESTHAESANDTVQTMENTAKSNVIKSLESSGSHQIPLGMTPLKLHLLPTSSKLPQASVAQFDDSFYIGEDINANNNSLSNIPHAQSFHDPLRSLTYEDSKHFSDNSANNVNNKPGNNSEYGSVHSSVYDCFSNSILRSISHSVRTRRSLSNTALGNTVFRDSAFRDSCNQMMSSKLFDCQAATDSNTSSNNISANVSANVSNNISHHTTVMNSPQTNSPQHGPLQGNSIQEANLSLLSTPSTTAQNLSISLIGSDALKKHEKSLEAEQLSILIKEVYSSIFSSREAHNRKSKKLIELYEAVGEYSKDKIIELVREINGESFGDRDILFLSIINEALSYRLADKKEIWESLDPQVRNSDCYLMHVKNNGHYMHLSGDEWRMKTVIQRDLYRCTLNQDNTER